jgi:hypothetical protein
MDLPLLIKERKIFLKQHSYFSSDVSMERTHPSMHFKAGILRSMMPISEPRKFIYFFGYETLKLFGFVAVR